ncbi:MAG: UDP-N-acetylglucosamine 1-carboxyvinyltransferase, partial [Candidatus Dormibacteraceae bacterium]
MLAVRQSQKITIEGGQPLKGSIPISGSKNASLPLLSACLLTPEPITLTNVPRLADTRLMGEILTALGAEVIGSGEEMRVRAGVVSSEVSAELAGKLRGSIVLLGALLARVGRVRLPLPGGDEIGARRIGEHLRALRALGASIEELPDGILATAPRGLSGAQIVLDLPTVTGTENIMLAASLAQGQTEIHNAAREPHVQDLARLLKSMGARVEGAGSELIVIEGVSELNGCHHRVVPDYLE